LDKVYAALDWLVVKKNNPLYADVVINHSLKSKSLLLFSTEDSELTKHLNLKFYSYLQNLKDLNDIDHYTVQETEPINLNFLSIEKYSLKKIQAVPFTDRDKFKDMLCFVDLFPKGRGGMYQDRPLGKVQPAMFLRWQLMNENPSVRRNIQYLLSCLHNKDIRSVDQGIYATLQTTKFPDITAGKLIEHIRSKDRKLEGSLSTTMSKVRGSPDYWSLRRGDLKVFDEYFGPATLFFTLSCNEYDWSDLHHFLIKQNKDLKNVESIPFNELRAKDPVSVSIFYEKKLKMCLKHLLLNKDSIFGEVVHHFYRREYQARGTPHCHGKLWIKDAPVYGVDSNERVLEFINKNITCRLPDPIKEPKLYNLVTKYQMHRCGPSCLKLRGNLNIHE